MKRRVQLFFGETLGPRTTVGFEQRRTKPFTAKQSFVFPVGANHLGPFRRLGSNAIKERWIFPNQDVGAKCFRLLDTGCLKCLNRALVSKYPDEFGRLLAVAIRLRAVRCVGVGRKGK